eukprot:gene9373-10360_t
MQSLREETAPREDENAKLSEENSNLKTEMEGIGKLLKKLRALKNSELKGSEKETLLALGNLLDEFFSGNTTNERKRAIEEILDNFSHQEGAWRQCIYFLTNSTNQYVHMYSLSIFERLVNQRWFGMPSDDKQEIRKFCLQFLMLQNTSCPSFIKKKMAKIYVDIGRVDWPQFFPDFYHNMLQCFRNDSTVSLGLTLLQMTSEEFISPREDLNNARKQELRSLLLEQAANTLEKIMHILDTIVQKLKLQTNTVTPPSSPRQRSPFASPCTSPTPHPTTSPLFIDKTNVAVSTSSAFLSQNITKNEGFLPNLDAFTEEVILAALSCVHQLFTWMPLQNLISSNLVEKLFIFAGYGSINYRSDQKPNQIGTLAMECINEIMTKNYVPVEYENFLMKIFQQTFRLLQHLTKSNSNQLGNGTLARLDESYLEKFTEFLSLFVGIHLKRFEPERSFPTEELLFLLVKYSVLQPTVQGFFHCLDVWTTFLDYLNMNTKSLKGSNGVRENDCKKYATTLMDLLAKLLCKIQLRYNEAQLVEMDDDDHGDDGSLEISNESEKATFIKECLEVIAKIADIYPEEVVVKVVEVLQSNLDVYFGLESHISDHSLPGRRLQLSNSEELRHLHVCLVDLSTSLQAIGRLAHLFFGDENLNKKLEDGLIVVERLCRMVMFGTYYKLYSIKSAQSESLTKDLINVHAHGLACLQAFSHWLELYQLESKRKNESMDKFGSIVSSLLEGSLPLLQSTIPRRILLAASQLILSLNTTVRPQSFLTLDIVQKFYGTMGAGGLEALPINIQVAVSCSLSNAFVLPWPLVPQEAQEWDMRSSHHKCLINSFTREYQHLPEIRVLSTNLEERNRCKDYVKRICRILSGIIDAVAGQSTKSKSIVHQSTHEAIQITTNLLPVYLTHTDVAEDILALLLITIKGLKIQIGVNFVQHIIQQLLALLTREHIAKIVEQNNESGYRVIDNVLKMLEFIVQEHDSSFKALISGIIDFNLQQILPVLAKYPAAEMKTTVIGLLHQLLLHNWRFFFKADVLSKMAGQDTLHHEDLFISIIKEIGEALMDTDITLFKKSLEILQNLNERYKLYSKPVFQSKMLPTFLHVLLNLLVSQTHDLLKEDIILTIHSMASIDLANFNAEFMQRYLMQSDDLTDHQKTDLLKTFQNQEVNI